MSNGKGDPPHDHPGEYRFLPKPIGNDAKKALSDVQEAQGFYLVAMDEETMAFYKKDKEH